MIFNAQATVLPFEAVETEVSRNQAIIDSIEVHNTLEDARHDWQRLEAEGECFAFQTYFWVETWHRLIGAKLGVSPHIVVLRSPCGDPAMVIPLGIRREGGLRSLSFLPHTMSDYQGPLMAKGVGETLAGKFRPLWARILSEMPSVDQIDFARMPEVIGDAANPFLQLPGAARSERAYAAPLPATHSAFLTGKRKSIHRDSQRKLRRLAEIGAVSFQRITDEKAIAETVEIMAFQKGPRYVHALGFNWFERMPEAKTFYAQLGAFQSNGLSGHVSTMTVGGVVVATHVGMVFRDRFYMLLPSYAGGEWYKYSTGRLLLEHLMETAIEEGYSVFDYTVGDDAYKKDWTETVLSLYEFKQPLSVRARAWQGVVFAKRKLRADLKKVTWVREGAVRLRERLRRRKILQAEKKAREISLRNGLL